MAEQSENFSIKITTKGKLPRLPFVKIKEEILGKKYELSLVFIGDHLSKKFNNKFRHINKPTNILSFPLSKTDGEIFINLKRAEKDAFSHQKSYNKFIVYLFIHGLLHLNGYKHGEKMQREEEKYLKKFKI